MHIHTRVAELPKKKEDSLYLTTSRFTVLQSVSAAVKVGYWKSLPNYRINH